MEALLVKNSLNGEYTDWYENGQLRSSGLFQNDLKIGDWKYFEPTGEIAKVPFKILEFD